MSIEERPSSPPTRPSERDMREHFYLFILLSVRYSRSKTPDFLGETHERAPGSGTGSWLLAVIELLRSELCNPHLYQHQAVIPQPVLPPVVVRR